jgi:ribosomal-protein-alanine N-acetyltransferase
MNDLNFPNLASKRLLLRKLEKSDAAVILYLRSDEKINEFIERPESRKTKTIAQALQFIATINEEFTIKKSVTWGITIKNERQLIGTICLWNFSEDQLTAEVGYGLNPEFQNQGIMSEALQCVLNYGFKELNLMKVEAFTNRHNESSKRILKKSGFELATDRKDADNSANYIYELHNKMI